MADKQLINKNSQVESPCVRNCCLNENDVCMGCFRHVDEICEWGSASNQHRRCILNNAALRRKEHIEKYGAGF